MQKHLISQQTLQQISLTEIESVLTRFREQISTGGLISIEAFPKETFIRQTPLYGPNTGAQTKQIAQWPPVDDLYFCMLAQPIDLLALESVSYMAGTALGCLQFSFKNGAESPKYGGMIQVKELYTVRDSPHVLKKVTVLQNKIALQGLVFTYEDNIVDEIKGPVDPEGQQEGSYGPMRSSELVLAPGELIVGVQIEMADDIPRKIGFTVLKTIN